jgi:FixJ family two-component response regulator
MVYLIDDDKSVRRAFEIFLKSAGLPFTSYENATDFLSIFKTGKQDVIVLDLNLPGLNGCDLLKKMDQDGIHVPVIVVTAFDDQDSRECCIKYGVKAYLRKPVDGEALIDIIKFNLPD